jgi:very-short-patch-repair endonuclease
MSDSPAFPSPSGRGVRGEGRRPKAALPSELLDFARTLRTEQTDPESFLWHLLRDRRLLGLKFRRQHPLPPYVLDFYCDEIKLAVELDGGQHNEDEIAARDLRRDQFVASHGIELARYWNHDFNAEDGKCLGRPGSARSETVPLTRPCGPPSPGGRG